MYSRSFNIKKDLAMRNEFAKKALDANPSHPQTNYDYGLFYVMRKNLMRLLSISIRL